MSLPTLDNLAPKEAGGAATKFPGIVADLDTRPNAIGGLSAAELKAKFDEAARVIQNYINNVLLPALLSGGAASIGYQTSSDLPDYQPSTVDDALAGLEYLVASLLPIKNNGKACFCNNLTIPSSGSISVAYNSIYPRPLVGDYVINQNGEMGHITSVVIGDAVTVTAANYTLKAVLTDETQNLSATQKARARSNIGALSQADTDAKYVKYDGAAVYTDTQKETARANIGALEKANPHVETGMTVDGVLDAEGGIEAYDGVTVEGALIVKNASQENGLSLAQTGATVLSFSGATPQTKPVLRNVGTPVLNNDAANKAYVDAKAGLSETAKQALLNCFVHVAWTDEHGQDYYDALEAALYPPTNLVSISAVFEQGQTVVYDTDSLDVLKPMLTVTAHYSDSTTETITAYTLSGTLTEGTSTITVSYGGKSTIFNVTVTYKEIQYCEYIELNDETGNDCWIETNIIPSNTFGFKLTVQRNPNITLATIAGIKETSGESRCWVTAPQNAAGQVRVGWNVLGGVSTGTMPTNGPCDISVNYKNSRNWKLDNETVESNLPTLYSFTRPFILMGKDNVGTINGSKQRFFGAEFTLGSDVSHRFVPAYKRRTGEIGLYEEIEGVFYSKSGTGNFVKGGDV